MAPGLEKFPEVVLELVLKFQGEKIPIGLHFQVFPQNRKESLSLLLNNLSKMPAQENLPRLQYRATVI